MMRTILLSAIVVIGTIRSVEIGVQAAQRAPLAVACNMPQGPFCDAGMAPLPNWAGQIFHLSQTYPTSPGGDVQPWLQFDPRSQPLAYLKSLLGYFFEGNIQGDVEASFDPTLNQRRGWYNAPWQDLGLNGREFIHGLTRERVSRVKELDPRQAHPWNNYAVGFYNAPGGFVIGRVWADHGRPDPSVAQMPDGTVAAKLLFTTATVVEVPYLVGAPEWNAYIYSDVNNPTPAPNSPRAVVKVRLVSG
jgi:hypothetical protein